MPELDTDASPAPPGARLRTWGTVGALLLILAGATALRSYDLFRPFGYHAQRLSHKGAGIGGRILVQEMVSGSRELVAGMNRDAQLGPCVMFGLGGVFVEVMRDVAFALAPLSRPEARSLMREIKGFPILEGVRGQGPVDVPALADALCRLSRLLVDNPRIAELDMPSQKLVVLKK